MEEPLVSVIMGVYNGEKTIRSCIDSIVSQTYQNWEFIICNDCSSDRTQEILEEYSNMDDRFFVIQNHENMRLAASLNKCLDLVKGKYVARMDADDISMSHRLKMQVGFLEKHTEYDVVGSIAEVWDGEKIVEIRMCKEIPDKETLLTTTPFIHPSIMMRTHVYKELGGYSVSERTNRGQDWDLWFRFYAAGHCGYNIQEALLLYRETKEDYSKRTFIGSINMTKTALLGFKYLNIPAYKYFLAFKPIISYFIPQKLKRNRRKHLNRV